MTGDDAAYWQARTAGDTLIAHATNCTVDGCDGLMHTTDAADSWIHGVASGVIATDICWDLVVDAKGHAYVGAYSAWDGDMTADELRAMADEYESAPAKFRALADDLDRRNAS